MSRLFTVSRGYVFPKPSYNVKKLVPQLKFKIRPQHMKFRTPEGPFGRLKKLRKTVAALIKHERLELNYPRAQEARGYAERLIADAIRNGDCHRPTMEMADFWLEEKQLIHKLFKVLVPRFHGSETAFTKMLQLPSLMTDYNKRTVLELNGNPYPPVVVHTLPRSFQLQNVLLREAKKDYHSENSLFNDDKRFQEESEDHSVETKGNETENEEQLIDDFKKLNTEPIPNKEVEK